MALEEFRLKFGKVLMELIGTAMLVLTIQLTVSAKDVFAPVAIGLILMIAVYAGGPISGGHFNPAVSLAVFIRGRLPFDELMLYWLFQIGGGICGALLGGVIGGQTVAQHLGEGYHVMQAFLAELTFTAILCLTVLATATNDNAKDNSYYGAAIGTVVLVGIVAVGPITGAGFNPAVSLGLAIVKHFWDLAFMIWIVVAQLVGGVAGTMLFYLVAPDQFEHVGEEATRLLEEGRRRAGEAARLLPRPPGQGA